MKNENRKSLAAFVITLLILLTATFLLFGSSDSPSDHKHKFTRYKTLQTVSEFSPGIKERTCKTCGEKQTKRKLSKSKLPQLYLDGNTDEMAKDYDSILQAEYVNGAEKHTMFARVKFQGHSSIGFEKKNYTVKFYKDEMLNNKYSFSVNGWKKTFKYCLKANYIDSSNARNIVASNIWSDVVASRENLDSNIASLEFYGGIDGFPVALFINGEYKGIYTFNIPKDDSTFKIADSENEALFVINSDQSDSADFRALINEKDKINIFDLEYSYNDDNQWPYESLNNMISFLMENDGKAFVKDASKFIDTDAAIDYLITTYVLGLTANFSKNMILITYDGKKWIPDLYDLDTAGGLSYDGTGFFESDFSLPSINKKGEILSGTKNLLWDRILNNYTEEFVSRYNTLRQDILKTENILQRYRDYISQIPEEYYEKEREMFPDKPFVQDDYFSQIEKFLTARTQKLDSIIKSIQEATEK